MYYSLAHAHGSGALAGALAQLRNKDWRGVVARARPGCARVSRVLKRRRAALISNRTVFKLYGRLVTESLRGAGFAVNHWLVGDGERHKSFRSLEKAVEFLSQNELERNDVVVALGGGVVGDLAGFAAAIYLRGIAFIQVPTTLLAQIDASVGGKTGVNLPTGKNLLGAFHQPRLVVIDTATLRTLPARELTSGWCEAVKQGAVGSRKLFDQTVAFLRQAARTLVCGSKVERKHMPPKSRATFAAHCRFKASIVAGDERENLSRADRRSRRILKFWPHYGPCAGGNHGLSSLPPRRGGRVRSAGCRRNFEKSRHACTRRVRINSRGGRPLRAPASRKRPARSRKLRKAMAGDKKSLAGSLKWVLLERIGRARGLWMAVKSNRRCSQTRCTKVCAVIKTLRSSEPVLN